MDVNMCMQKLQNVSHEVPFMIVGQDAGDVPISRGQRLKYVCAGVRLEENLNVKHQTFNANIIRIILQLLTREVDIDMWKNFPLPPWGIALVKKNLCPSWEKSGASFWKERKTSACLYIVCVPKRAGLQGFSIFCFCLLLVRAQTHGTNTCLFFSTNCSTTTGKLSSRTCLCNQLSLSSSCFWE